MDVDPSSAGSDPGCLAVEPLILASASRARAEMLSNAGLSFEIRPASIDEVELKRALRAEGAEAPVIAEWLAERKALYVSSREPDRLVVGADQILECDGEMFDKPVDRAEAMTQLRMLRGRSHELSSCASVAYDGQTVWHHIDRARLWMRDCTDGFLERYLDAIGDAALTGPGAYQIEGPGAQLFNRIEGSHFTILGLPLLPLLDFLRARGVVPT